LIGSPNRKVDIQIVGLTPLYQFLPRCLEGRFTNLAVIDRSSGLILEIADCIQQVVDVDH
jgi:hypothetical protein